MTTYILTVDPIKFDRNNHIFSKVGKPTEIHDMVIVESTAPLAEILRVTGVKTAIEDFENDVDNNAVESDWGASFLGKNKNDSFNGDGVNVYLIDSGVRDSHVEFKDNKIVQMWSFDGVPYSKEGVSPSHGTACCSMILGMAPKATIHSIRTDFRASTSLKAFDMIIAAHKAGNNNSVVSMSFSSTHDFYHSLTIKMYVSGIIMVGSSGNQAEETPRFPAARKEVFSVGALDKNGQLTSFTNGTKSGNDFWAPGIYLKAASVDSDNTYYSFSGTSASAPLVAGISACALTGSEKLSNPEGVEWVKSQLKKNSKSGKSFPGGGVIPLASGFTEKYKHPVVEPEPVVPVTPPEPVVPVTPPEPVAPVEPPVVAPIEPPAPTPVEKEKKKDKTPIIAGAVAAVVIIAVLAYHFLYSGA